MYLLFKDHLCSKFQDAFFATGTWSGGCQKWKRQWGARGAKIPPTSQGSSWDHSLNQIKLEKFTNAKKTQKIKNEGIAVFSSYCRHVSAETGERHVGSQKWVLKNAKEDLRVWLGMYWQHAFWPFQPQQPHFAMPKTNCTLNCITFLPRLDSLQKGTLDPLGFRICAPMPYTPDLTDMCE